jgi:hypothetical protein
MAAFQSHGTLMPFGGPVLRAHIIANSVAMTHLASTKLSSGFVALGTTGALVFGHTVEIETNQGVGPNTDGTAGAALGSYLGAYTVSSTNQTVAFVRAKTDISKFTLYSAALDDTIATTTGSNLAGYSQDLADSTQLDESTAATTTGQYMNHGVDPVSSSRVIVNIYESVIFGV